MGIIQLVKASAIDHSCDFGFAYVRINLDSAISNILKKFVHNADFFKITKGEITKRSHLCVFVTGSFLVSCIWNSTRELASWLSQSKSVIVLNYDLKYIEA
jgi:hypothetical protein